MPDSLLHGGVHLASGKPVQVQITSRSRNGCYRSYRSVRAAMQAVNWSFVVLIGCLCPGLSQRIEYAYACCRWHHGSADAATSFQANKCTHEN
eukprot:scaffold183613_cov14-Prasinocladus_malaysianus.AAC.1